MTYQHALRYLTQSQSSTKTASLSLSQLFPAPLKMDTPPVILCLGKGKQSRIVAKMLCAMLSQANLPHLSYLHDEALEPKLRFLYNGKPIPPPVLCHHAEDIRAAELQQIKQAGADIALPTQERAVELIARCTVDGSCRAVLLECAEDVPLLRLLLSRIPRAIAITLLSEDNSIPRESIREGTREVISPAGGQELFRRISDACARSGSRLTLVAGASCQRTNITPASQLLHYHALRDCRILSGCERSARAGFLALQTVLSLSRYGLSLSEDAIRTGLGRADLTHDCSLLSISPLVLSDAVQNEQELAASLRDLSALAAVLPAPRHVWLEDTLSFPGPLPEWIDQSHKSDEPLIPPASGSAVILGTRNFIENLASGAHKRHL
ncbi:MAG: hypothetical protein E7625_06395 [Ruminococcaceae bacterium]|nr:hypothetical protein [Oscillospiraceae bacterium]